MANARCATRKEAMAAFREAFDRVPDKLSISRREHGPILTGAFVKPLLVCARPMRAAWCVTATPDPVPSPSPPREPASRRSPRAASLLSRCPQPWSAAREKTTSGHGCANVHSSDHDQAASGQGAGSRACPERNEPFQSRRPARAKHGANGPPGCDLLDEPGHLYHAAHPKLRKLGTGNQSSLA
jgi:hypothetical protein